jgi:hypothetical protein
LGNPVVAMRRFCNTFRARSVQGTNVGPRAGAAAAVPGPLAIPVADLLRRSAPALTYFALFAGGFVATYMLLSALVPGVGS